MTASPAIELPVENPFRARFPALMRTVRDRPLIYLDSAATSLRPGDVIDAGCTFCRLHDGNPHRGLHTLSAEATEALEGTRILTADFIGAASGDDVVYTRNATAALNLVARGLESRLGPGDEILLTEMEHHANLVPWLTTAKRTGARVRYLPIDEHGLLRMDLLDELITDRTRIVAFTAVSNVLGTINDVAAIAEAARRKGALSVLDAAQAVGHMPFRFVDTGVDFAAFSAHKCYGPTGLGFLVGRAESLERLEPLETGGDMIEYVDYERATWAPVPHRFEAGTPNAGAAVSFGRAVEFIREIGLENIRQHEMDITAYALDALQRIHGLLILGPLDPSMRGGLVSFVDPQVHPHDLATILDEQGIAVRAGHHCAQPLHRKLGLMASTRASFGVYTEKNDIDALKEGILKARKVFAL